MSNTDRNEFLDASPADIRAKALADALAALPDVTMYEAQQVLERIARTRPVTFLHQLAMTRDDAATGKLVDEQRALAGAPSVDRDSAARAFTSVDNQHHVDDVLSAKLGEKWAQGSHLTDAKFRG